MSTRALALLVALVSACGGRTPLELALPTGDALDAGSDPSPGQHQGEPDGPPAPPAPGPPRPLPPPPPPPDLPAPCPRLDESTCLLRSDCAADHCDNCTGLRPDYQGCREVGAPAAVCPDPPLDCLPTCAGLDEASCEVASCQASYCQGCAGQPIFITCDRPGIVHPCEPPICPVPDCEALNLSACDGRPDCHAVFTGLDPFCTADCDDGLCCSDFSHCASGRQADCGAALCDIVPPDCEPPLVLATRGNCYDGCVRPHVCAP